MLSAKVENNKMVPEALGDFFDEDLERESIETGFYRKREIMNLPPSAKFVLFLLRLKGAMNRKNIIRETLMPDRTCGFAIKKLLEKNLIQKVNGDLATPNSGHQRRRNRKQDRRVTNYNIVSSSFPFEMG